MDVTIYIDIYTVIYAGGGGILLFLPASEEPVIDTKFTEKIIVSDGMVDKKEQTTSFTIQEDGAYMLYVKWQPETKGLLTGFHLLDETGKSIYAFTAESIEIKIEPMELKAGEYTINYVFLSNEELLNAFYEDAEFEDVESDYVFGTNGTHEINYHFKLLGEASLEYKSGIAVGLLVSLLGGAVLIIYLLKATKNDGKIKCQYDERQLLVRGNGFKFGFITLCAYNVILAVVESCGLKLPFGPGVLLILGMILGCFVCILYCIAKEAYVSLNENINRLTIALSLIAVANIVIGVRSLIAGDMVENGLIELPVINLCCGILMSIVVIFMNIRYHEAEAEEKDLKNLKLKSARAALDLSQQELADKVGVSRQTINAIEKGDYNPTIQLCKSICKVLGKTLDELFWDE